MNYDTDMQQYKDFQPTAFDPKGHLLETRHDWYVLPTTRSRVSGVLDQSNFECALKILGGERTNIVEVHRFGHWGPGWFEIIIVNPRAGKTMRKAISIEAGLADYPIVDEDDFSQKEYDAMCEVWEQMSLRERIAICCDTGNSIFAARNDEYPEGTEAYMLGVD